jgi:hypothetical protein
MDDLNVVAEPESPDAADSLAQERSAVPDAERPPDVREFHSQVPERLKRRCRRSEPVLQREERPDEDAREHSAPTVPDEAEEQESYPLQLGPTDESVDEAASVCLLAPVEAAFLGNALYRHSLGRAFDPETSAMHRVSECRFRFADAAARRAVVPGKPMLSEGAWREVRLCRISVLPPTDAAQRPDAEGNSEPVGAGEPVLPRRG